MAMSSVPGIVLSAFIKLSLSGMPCHAAANTFLYIFHDAAILNFDRANRHFLSFFEVVACDTTGGVLVWAEY